MISVILKDLVLRKYPKDTLVFEFNGCGTKALSEWKGKDYIEDCPGSFEGLHNLLILRLKYEYSFDSIIFMQTIFYIL